MPPERRSPPQRRTGGRRGSIPEYPRLEQSCEGGFFLPHSVLDAHFQLGRPEIVEREAPRGEAVIGPRRRKPELAVMIRNHSVFRRRYVFSNELTRAGLLRRRDKVGEASLFDAPPEHAATHQPGIDFP